VKKKIERSIEIRFFGYECPECGNDTWLADAPEKFIYCAHCGGDEGKLVVTSGFTMRGIKKELPIESD
jgi:ribosomal protein S27E